MCETNNKALIQGGTVLTGGKRRKADVRVENGKITQIGENLQPAAQEQILDASGCYVTPGFLDIHTHGGANVDVNGATAADFETIGKFFASNGTTSWHCSILTDSEEQTLKCIGEALKYIKNRKEGAQLMGIHLEGPFLSQAFRGSMPTHLIREKLDVELLKKYQKAAEGYIRYITIAPELEGAVEAIPEIQKLGIHVAIGHSGADYDTAMAAIAAGAEAATHTMNAMRPLEHHNTGIAGAVLESDVYCEAICDGIHLHPGMVRLLLKTKGIDRVICITDSIMAAGLPDGRYKLGVNDVTVTNGDAKVTGTNIRAGSTLTTRRAIRNLVRFTGYAPETVLKLMTENPARMLKLPNKGAIGVGMDADILLMDQELNVLHTMIAGKVEH